MKPQGTHRIPFAISAAGKVVSVAEVERGLACGCTCPACNDQLVAKKGDSKKRVWHFAHHAGASCAGALETSLHLAGKEIIAQERRILLPACNAVYGLPDKSVYVGRVGVSISGPFTYLASWHNPQRYAEDPEVGFGQHPASDLVVEFDEVFLERNEGDLRPDIVGIVAGRRLYIEIAVTHFVDAKKLERLRRRQVPTIEIELPYETEGIDWDRLRSAVVGNTSLKNWIFHPDAERLAEADFHAKGPRRLQEQEARRQQAAKAELDNARLQLDREQNQRAIQDAEQRERDFRYLAQRVLEKKAEASHQSIRRQLSPEEQAFREEVDGARRMLYELSPSPHLPVGNLPVIFLDYDAATGEYGPRSPFMRQLEEALRDLPCSFVVTSEIRYSFPEQVISDFFEYFGGRHVSCTPVLDPLNPYGTRQKEIDSWLESHDVTNYLIIDGATVGFVRRPLQVWRGETIADLPERIHRWMVNSRLYRQNQ